MNEGKNIQSDREAQPVTECYELIKRSVNVAMIEYKKDDDEKHENLSKKMDRMLELMRGVPSLAAHNYIHYAIDLMVVIAFLLFVSNSCT